MSTIDDVTLVTIETHYNELAARALEETVKRIPFKNVVTFSNRNIYPGAKNVPVNVIPNIRDYCDIMLKSMWPFIETSHMIFAQWDAMVFDGSQWTDEFLEYDYIGAIWPWEPPGQNVGCGGFSLRSAKLLQALRDPMIQMTPESRFGMKHEDAYIGVVHRQYLDKKFGIRFAPPEVAAQFSYELGSYSKPSMSFHGFWNVIKFMPAATVDFFVTNRPPGMFNELHRCHHTIAAMAETGRVDLVELCADEIRAGADYAQVIAWLNNEDFPNKSDIMSLIS
jgi:hypothetical protein